MKTKIIFLMATMLLMSVCSFAQNGNTPLKGDVNGDGKVDVADIVAILKIMKDAGGQGELKENTVTFIDRGTVLKSITGQEGTPVTAPEVSAWSGHNFVGWNETESAGVGVEVITQIETSNVTYYAQWEEQTTYYWYVGTTKPTAVDNPSAWRTSNSDAGFIGSMDNYSDGTIFYVAYPDSWTLVMTDKDDYTVEKNYLSQSITNSISGYKLNKFTSDGETSTWKLNFTK